MGLPRLARDSTFIVLLHAPLIIISRSIVMDDTCRLQQPDEIWTSAKLSATGLKTSIP